MTGKVLVFSRRLITGFEPFTPALGEMDLGAIGDDCWWEARTAAERSTNAVQAIPAAVLCDSAGNYLLLQRVDEARKSLRSRLSLVIGGHVEPPAGADLPPEVNFETLLRTTLLRELREELSLQLDPGALESVGMVVDPRGLDASRHVAFVYRATLGRSMDVDVTAFEEFAVDSAFSTRMWPGRQLRRLLPSLDPWSAILVRSGALLGSG
ncbi:MULTISPECIES: NUDIX domain-containing protein [unclassified Nocardioides]|uniref:NUDIX domain-containing protein n=1 Tax=unclassified Nocardioides TaxID=2615069 RepID=UPI0000570372|nr:MULTISPECIES: NUDIX domain-containing protein [unclassified Nocardioides]ABL84149.1 NUDIX hydrolase [Nocardioides sp. JS614]